MRPLTSAELIIVAGGTDPAPTGSDIVIQAQSSYYTGAANPYSSYNGSSDPRFQYYMAWTAAHGMAISTDMRTDDVAKSVAHDFLAKGDLLLHQEFSAFLYKDGNGTVHQSNILPGASTNAGGHSISEYGIPDGSTLIGFIHNHPDYYGTDTNLNPARSYTDNADMLQIMNASNQAWEGHITVDQTEFRGYILHDNVLDEYDYASHVQDLASFQNGVGNYARPDVHPDASFTVS